MKQLLQLSLVAVLSFVIISCKKKKEEEPTPNANLITKIYADKTVTKPGYQVTITVELSDASLQPNWESSSGSVLPNNPSTSAVYYPCASCGGGTTTITCTVTNGSVTDKKTVDIVVNN